MLRRFEHAYASLAPIRAHSPLALVGAALLLVASVGAVVWAVAPEQVADLAARTFGNASTRAVQALDRDATQAAAQAAAIANTDDCFPLHVRDMGEIGVLFLHCAPEAFARDGETMQISENFSVDETIARRFNFWRRVYSLWSKDQYVMHLSQWPEVVFEAYDVSRAAPTVGPVARENMVKKVARTQRDTYRTLLLAMHAQRRHEEGFTPAMRRIAGMMAHIKDDDKYLTAYRSLRLQRGQRDFIAAGLAVAPRYFGAIEAEFTRQGIPVEISRLAFVESSFNLRALSKVGASGVYQLMPETGRQYLRVVSGIDERNDPIKASSAAAKLLKLYFNMTGSWPLAITAYNHGVGGIKRAVREVGSGDIAHLINNYRGNAFGFAGKNFYASFLGVLATLKEADRLFPEVTRPEPMRYSAVKLPAAMPFPALHKKYNVSLEEIAALNPDLSRTLLRASMALPRGYVLKVPSHEPVPRHDQNLVPASLPPSS